jgi:E3 ubiquitin-protein ligase UBR7
MYLLDDEDTMESYETLGKAKQESERIQAEESFVKQVNDLGHVGQIELISGTFIFIYFCIKLSIEIFFGTGYNDMKEGLREFLNEFAENGKVVQAEDVKKFFEDLRATKRPRLDL